MAAPTRAARRAFAARVRELHRRHRALRFDETRDARQHLDVLVFPDAEILRRDTSARFDGRGFREYDPRAADRAASEVHQMPVRCKAIVGRILTHGRHDDAIAQRNIANLIGFE